MTAAAVATAYEPTVHAEEYSLSVSLIDPDPAQPRLEVDDELAASIKEHGILKAIEVRPHPDNPDRFMIVDGERRWRGAMKAGESAIPAKITFDVEGVSLADRMVRQIVHNTGKPLTPVEEAVAFRKIIDDRRAGVPVTPNAGIGKGSGSLSWLVQPDPKYGPVALARELGIPKSTVTDRLAATEIPNFWLKLIVDGPLQSSHVPALYRYRDVPEKYQLRALEKIREHHGGWGRSKGADRVHVDEFTRWLDEAMRSYIKPVSEVPGYKGPTARIGDVRSYGRRVTVMAMDATMWQSIYQKRLAEKRAKTIAAGGAAAKQSAEMVNYRKQEEARQREYAAQQRRTKQLSAARPALAAAFAEKLAVVPVRELQAFVLDALTDGRRSKGVAKLVAVGTTPEQFVRHLAMLEIDDQLGETWQLDRKLPALGRRFKVDVAKIVTAKEEAPAKQPAPKTTDPGEAGDGFLAVDGDEVDEDSDA